MAKSNKPVRITSPIGVAKWAFIDKPSTKFNPDGEYNVTLVLDSAEGAALEKTLLKAAEAAREEMVAEAKKPAQAKARKSYRLTCGITKEEDEEGEETGNYVLKAKRDASYEGRDGKVVNVSIPVFDAKKNPVAGGVQIGRGSKLRVAVDLRPYAMDATQCAGVSLRLAGVQVIDLVAPGGGASADACGFGEEEGYEGGGDDSAEGAETEGGSGDGGGEGDDF